MEDEIKVGEYVRTNHGYIIKINEETTIWNEGYKEQYVDMETTMYGLPFDEEITKHSSNIIDLIEVGDYVNGYYVEKVWEQVNYRMAIDLRGSYLGLSDDKFIKTIVTHEQFKSIEYTIHEREEKENDNI